MLLFFDAFSHFLVDALCAATIFGPVARAGEITNLILLYNTLAFSTQCLVGLAADRIRRHGLAAPLSLLVTASGFLLPLDPLGRIVVIGCGNSVFHVAGGARTLEHSGGRAGPLGVFVAPGAIGLTLGTLFPSWGIVFAVLAGIMAVLYAVFSRKEKPTEDTPKTNAAAKVPLLAILFLTLAVAVRAVGGSVVSFPWKDGAAAALCLTLAVWAGKTAGGFVCDRLGPSKAALLSVPAAALLIAFTAPWMIPSLAGQFALNLTMPITLWLMYRAMPDSPGFAFGIAASALWPGTVAGLLIPLTGPAATALTLASFLFGLGAILYAAKTIERGEAALLPEKENIP
ncbi:MAG: hypothetical protein II889_08675 [Clostridia bacterium]|nr:hypothetical protein [Clostridia bacterium]